MSVKKRGTRKEMVDGWEKEERRKGRGKKGGLQ